MNEALDLAKKHPKAYSNFKKKLDSVIRLEIREQRIPKIKAPVAMIIKWYVKNKKMDPDNIFSGAKYILDAMQDRYTYIQLRGKRTRVETDKGIWDGDGFKQFPGGLLHIPLVDPDDPRIEVYLFENLMLHDVADNLIQQ